MLRPTPLLLELGLKGELKDLLSGWFMILISLKKNENSSLVKPFFIVSGGR